jgi:hypothetical protein
LIAKYTKVRGDNFEFLTDGIYGLIKPGMIVLVWPLGGWNCGLQAPMLRKDKMSATVNIAHSNKSEVVADILLAG